MVRGETEGRDREEEVLTLRREGKRGEGGRNPSGVLFASNTKIIISLGPSGCLLLGLGKYPPCPYSAGGKLEGGHLWDP